MKILLASRSAPDGRRQALYLRSSNHDVEVVVGGQRASDNLEAGAAYDLLITDIDLPEVNGILLLTIAKTLRPLMSVIVRDSKKSPSIVEEVERRGGIFVLLQKDTRGLDEALAKIADPSS